MCNSDNPVHLYMAAWIVDASLSAIIPSKVELQTTFIHNVRYPSTFVSFQQLRRWLNMAVVEYAHFTKLRKNAVDHSLMKNKYICLLLEQMHLSKYLKKYLVSIKLECTVVF